MFFNEIFHKFAIKNLQSFTISIKNFTAQHSTVSKMSSTLSLYLNRCAFHSWCKQYRFNGVEWLNLIPVTVIGSIIFMTNSILVSAGIKWEDITGCAKNKTEIIYFTCIYYKSCCLVFLKTSQGNFGKH